MSFSYLTFLHHPIASLAFFSLILAFISLWIHKKTWLWASFLVVTFAFAFYAHLIDLKVFVALGFLAGFHLILATKVTGWMRLTAFVLAFAVSIALMGHFIPGFHNWKLLDGVQISKDAYPYTLYLNMDKPFVGFFPLAFTIPLIASKFHLRSIAFKTVILAILGTLVLLVLSLYLGVIAIDLKFPRSAFIYMIANLFLVTIPEEAFFRGFLQREIDEYIQAKWSGPFSILAVSILFAVFHFGYVKDLNFISLTFVASLIYGTVYHMTKCIESSIFCHYLTNLIHFFCFTYPAITS